MNRRLRQWLKAFHMLDRYDPMLIGKVNGIDRDGIYVSRVVMFRRSELEKKQAQYGDSLELLTTMPKEGKED